MTRKSESSGVFTVMGRAADESLEIASAIRAGRLTRNQFDAWYTKRRNEGEGLVITLREKASELVKPVEGIMTAGGELLRAAGPRTARPARRRRTARHASRKSKAK